jgi:hypothetical protein
MPEHVVPALFQGLCSRALRCQTAHDTWSRGTARTHPKNINELILE